jgi:hypothetical protein
MAGLVAALLAALVAISAAEQAGAAGALAGGTGDAAAAAGLDCTQACDFRVSPVCGADGDWYQNACIAACGGGVAAAADASACQGAAGAREGR